MKWKKEDINTDLVREFSSRFDIDLLTAAILVRRGVCSYEDAAYYLENDVRFLHNPFLFSEMEDAVDRIREAAAEGEKVSIFGDRDADGITSTVLLYQELVNRGIDAAWTLPLGDDPYGLTKAAVQRCKENDVTLIITVDCGISNTEEIAYAAELGIDTIVIDHHNPHSTVPNAAAIINPKMEDSGYPFEGLAGCAVVAKVIWALRFSYTPLYNHPVCLMNLRPGNETVIIEAVKLENLVEVDRIVENIVPGLHVEQTRLVQFLANQEIYIYDATLQKKMISRVFGEAVEVHAIDAAPEIWTTFPKLREKSLFRMRELSRFARYQQQDRYEIDIFISLFTSFYYEQEHSLGEEYLEILDLVALGTIADLMPLVNENRIIVRLGMELLNRGSRPGMHELMFKQNILAKTIGTKDIAWNISPLINATGRMGVPDKAVKLFLSPDRAERQQLADEIIALNRERKALGDKVWNTILKDAEESYQTFNRKMVLVTGKNIHRGITGIIAARLVNTFNVTSVVISIHDETAIGSVRSSGGVNVKNMLAAFSELFIDFGGHDFAAGFSIPLENLDRLRECLQTASSDMKTAEEEEEPIPVDAELPVKHMTPELIKIVEKFEPYGEGNQPLIFLLKNAVISGMSIIGKTDKQHIKMTVDTGGNSWPAIFWQAADRAGRDFSTGDSVNLLFRLGRNYFQNTEHLQLTVLDVEK